MTYPICNEDTPSLQFYPRHEPPQQKQQPDVIQKDKKHQEIQAQKQQSQESEQKEEKEQSKRELYRKSRPDQSQQKKSSDISVEGKGFNASLSFGTPDSSQTDSGGVSPQVRNKQKYTQSRDFLPKFSISIEDDHNRFVIVTKI